MGPTPILPPIRAVPFVFEANAAAAASRRLPVRPGVGTNPGEENLIRGISIMQRVLRRLIAAEELRRFPNIIFFMDGEVEFRGSSPLARGRLQVRASICDRHVTMTPGPLST